jgi:hypothetical protein
LWAWLIDALQITVAEPTGKSTRTTHAPEPPGPGFPRDPPSKKRRWLVSWGVGETEGRISWGLWSPKVAFSSRTSRACNEGTRGSVEQRRARVSKILRQLASWITAAWVVDQARSGSKRLRRHPRMTTSVSSTSCCQTAPPKRRVPGDAGREKSNPTPGEACEATGG